MLEEIALRMRLLAFKASIARLLCKLQLLFYFLCRPFKDGAISLRAFLANFVVFIEVVLRMLRLVTEEV